MGWIGVVELAAHGIAIQLASIAFMVPLGLSHASTVRVGQAYGAKNKANVWRAAMMFVFLSLVFGIMIAALFWIFPEWLVGLFLDENNLDAEQVTLIAASLVLVAAAFQLGDGIQIIASGALRGLSDTTIPMVISIFSYWLVGLAAAYVLAFPFDMGALGIWFGLAIGLTVSAFVLSIRFVGLAKKLEFTEGSGNA